MRIRAKGHGTNDVQWEIKSGKRVIAKGLQRGVRAGRAIDVTANWVAKTGSHRFTGSADPRNTLKESSRERKDNVRALSLRIGKASASAASAAPSFTVKAEGLSVSETIAENGNDLTIRLKISTAGEGSQDVSWRVARPGAPDAKGTKHGVKAGTSFEVIVPWKAKTGEQRIEAEVDPTNALAEPDAQRNDNRIAKELLVTDWDRWGEAAFKGAVKGVRQWQSRAAFNGIKIMGKVAIGPPGVLKGSTSIIKGQILAAMRTAQAPVGIADRFGRAVEEAWASWQRSVTVPNLPWYPAFAAFPGPAAPPTPNVPTPLVMLHSGGASGLMPNKLASTIKQRLGTIIDDHPGAEKAMTRFAEEFGRRFAIWRSIQEVRNVMGQGPVPTFKPPLVPVGPVVNGSVIPTPGVLASKKF